MRKEDYRSFFAECKSYLKLNKFCKIAKVSNVNLSRFLKGSQFDWCISLESLDRLYNVITEYAEKIA